MVGRGTALPSPETLEHVGLIQEVASSATFAKAPALRKLLLYLWENRAKALSEYAIALDALGKREDFDPKIDASVRVHISRLRAKLREYFENEGIHHSQRLVIPAGAHLIQIEPRPETTRESLFRVAVKRFGWVAAAIFFALLCGILAVRQHALKQELAQARQNLELPSIWQTILKPGRVTRVLYPMPVFYIWGELRVRDVKNNLREGWRDSPHLKPLVEMFGEPHVSQSYTVSSDTIAAIQLTRFHSSHGIPLEVTSTNNLLLNQYGSDNLIFLGIPPTNPSLDPYLKRLNFFLTPGNGSIGNRDPKPGEKAVFLSASGTPGSSVVERHGLVVVLPGHAPGTSLVLLMGLQTSALATFISSPMSINEWTTRWRNAGSPDHFEMVLRTQSDGVVTRSAEVVAFRGIR